VACEFSDQLVSLGDYNTFGFGAGVVSSEIMSFASNLDSGSIQPSLFTKAYSLDTSRVVIWAPSIMKILTHCRYPKIGSAVIQRILIFVVDQFILQIHTISDVLMHTPLRSLPSNKRLIP
jgi:hypothetical protein